MIKIKDIGNFKTVPEIVSHIISGNIDGLQSHLAEGWKINNKIKLGEYISLYPISIALIMENFDSIKWLVSQGVELNKKENFAFLSAVRYCNETIVRYLASHGAKLDGQNCVGSDAYSEALYGNNNKILPTINELGYSAKKNGGEAFRSAVSSRNYAAIDFFIAQGIDIDYSEADMVYPFKPTSLCVAARYVDLKMVKYLVKYGANITIAEKGGARPYTIAIEKGDLEMAEYFRSLEPEEFHNVENKLYELKGYKLPKELLNFLQGDNLRIEVDPDEIEFIDFFSFTDTIPMKFNRKKLLRISKVVDNYSHIILVWNPKTKKIAFIDQEHEMFGDVCGFEDFISNPKKYMNGIMEGEFDT